MLDVATSLEDASIARDRSKTQSRLSVTFAADGDGRAFIDRQFAAYPFHICRPHYFPHDAPGMATLYIQSSSGGLYQEDAHDIEIVAVDGARAHVTTQASTIVHGMARDRAVQRATITAGPGSHVEYIPDPLILFPASRLSTTLTVRVHESATAIVADSFLTHDPQSADGAFDEFEARITIEDWGGARLAMDRFRILGRDVLALTPGIMNGYRAQGQIMIVQRSNRTSEILTRLRAEIAVTDGVWAGASVLPNEAGIWLRLLARDGAALRTGMMAAWAAASEGITGVRPVPRRK